MKLRHIAIGAFLAVAGCRNSLVDKYVRHGDVEYAEFRISEDFKYKLAYYVDEIQGSRFVTDIQRVSMESLMSAAGISTNGMRGHTIRRYPVSVHADEDRICLAFRGTRLPIKKIAEIINRVEESVKEDKLWIYHFAADEIFSEKVLDNWDNIYTPDERGEKRVERSKERIDRIEGLLR